jgi:probable HAF family extracellular repeat protein
MNTGISMKVSVIASFVLLTTGGLEQQAQAAEDTYRVVELRDITNKPHVGEVNAMHLNNLSQIIGFSTDASGTLRPTYWYHFFPQDLYATYNGQILSATGLNDRSEISGSGRFPDGRFGLFILRRGKVEFQTYNGLELHASAPKMNNRNEVVYDWQGADMSNDVNFWFNGFIGGLIGNDAFNYPAAINNAGIVCGSSGFDDRAGPENPPAAWVSSANGVYHALIPPLPGDTNIGAADINDNNQVVGTSTNASTSRAYLWQDGVASDLHMTLPGHVSSSATALNDSTVIVGQSGSNSGGAHAVLWHNGTTLDLTAQIDASDPLKRYVKLSIANDINDAGEIIAHGIDTRSGRLHAYFLRPMRLPNINP